MLRGFVVPVCDVTTINPDNDGVIEKFQMYPTWLIPIPLPPLPPKKKEKKKRIVNVYLCHPIPPQLEEAIPHQPRNRVSSPPGSHVWTSC